MWLLVGLGNPGSRYAENRHNIGFMAVDELHRHFSYAGWQKKFHGFLADGAMGHEKVLLLKPETFMNESGRSVQAAVAFYKIPLDRVVVLHDEIELPFLKVRIKQGGGHAGHNGLRSIDTALGQDYWRMRLGVGRPEHKEQVHSHVLSDFNKDEMKQVDVLLKALAKEIGYFWKGDVSGLQNRLHLAVAPPKEPSDKKQSVEKTGE